MITPIPTIPATEILRHYKRIFEQLIATNQPMIVYTQNGTKVALITVKDLEKLSKMKRKESAKTLLSLAHEARKLTKDEQLPTDLSERHDEYLWEQ
jgi:hypothetical protein